jgi:hypothetical protein
MNFSEALARTKEGLKIIRRSWDESQHLNVVTGPDGEPLIALTETKVEITAWIPTTKDLFADDWEVRIDNG